MFRKLFSLLRVLKSRDDFEQGMSDELRFHIEQYTEDLVRSGLTAEEATRRARLEFTRINSIKGECREARGLRWPDELGRELRYATRLLAKTPGFTATALLTIALCLGANLAIFAVIQSVLLRPLPFVHADRLVTIFNTYPKAGVNRDGSSQTNYYERRGKLSAFESLAIYRDGTAIVGEPGSTSRVDVTRVSPEFFKTLGLGTVRGRAFSESETTYATDRVTILTDAYWRQHFNAAPDSLGRQIRVNGTDFTVIGILPVEFSFLSSKAQLYFPLASRPEDRLPAQRHSGGNSIQMVARLSPGVNLNQAQTQIDAQNNALELDDPQAKMMAEAGFRSLVVSLHADHVAAIRPTLLLLQAGALVLLLIGVVNLINLLLIRANGRVKELAVRQALGASRFFIVSEVAVETTLLTLSGGILGIVLGAAATRALQVLAAERLPLGTQLSFDMPSVLAGLATALLLGVVLAAPITWFNLRRDPGFALQSETRGGTTGRSAQALRQGLIVAQVALAFVLLTGAGLLGLSLQRAIATSPGFRADNLLTGQISMAGDKYSSTSLRLSFIDRMLQQLDQQPGVIATGVITNLPFSGKSPKSAAKIKGRVLQPGESPRGHYSYGVAGNYFGAMGFTLQAGRFLAASDSHRDLRVCVVDKDFAHYYWPHSNPIGRLIFQGSEDGKDSEAFTIVGVVGAVKQAGLTDDTAQGAVYYPFNYHEDGDIFVAARAGIAPELLGVAMQKAVRQVDADLPVNDIRSMDTRIADSLAERRSPVLLAGLFSAIALLLTAIGTYGVLAYAVAQRHREIGVRMALGARPEQILGQFLFISLKLLAVGLAAGAAGACLTSRAMQTLLFHAAGFDWPIFAGVAGLMTVVSIGSCLAPAWRAARISPMEALAGE